MKFRKVLSLLLSAAMLSGMATVAASAATVDTESVSASYYNASYLETYATSAYNETNLGSTYSPSSTTWKTWSPEATAVKLKLYKTGSDTEVGACVIGTYDLTKNSTTGVWSTTLEGDYKNVYYTYLVSVNGSVNETQDVYSKAVGVNGNRSMVVDLDSTDPEGWENDEHVLFDNAGEAVVWEVHVRDFSIAENSGVSEENKGKYLAFAEGGTKLSSDSSEDAVSTGIDYLVKAGINCVQLLPVYDFQSVDETKSGSSTNRNWGYDPMNYNVPEGSYSSNPYDGNVRITEFKQMIQALHDRGISVIMDVVYNHTYTTEGSCFSRTVPNYYFRKTSATTYSNGSGCGNETASDKLMYRKYMIESVTYWAEEYHIDGFRFDLMGIHDITTMNQVRAALDDLYTDGSGKKMIMYGEPWTGGSVAISDGCSQPKASQLDARVGMFCDSYRDAIKGGTNDASKGYIQGDTSKTRTVVNGVKGKCFSAKAPSQTIAYADAHDNLILWDKVVKSNSSSSWDSTSSEFTAQMKEAIGLLTTSQGVVFMTAGTEFCRTKQGDHNSYKSSDDINEIDWSRLVTYSEVSDFYQGMLKIRENYSPLTSATFSTPTFQSNYGYVVAYTYSNNTPGEWGKLCVLVNSGTQAYDITLDGSGWTVVADGKTAGLESLGTVSGNVYSVPARSACVLVESATFDNLKDTEIKYGTLTINHVDENGTTLKTATSTYKEGSTYRAIPDSTILYDYDLISTEGTTSGTVVGGENYTVTYTYKATGVKSGYLTVNYYDENGEKIKDSVVTKMKEGQEYQAIFEPIQGYQLNTDKYPAKTFGTFSGSDTEINFYYNALETTTTTVHYYLTNTNWPSVRCYAYTDDGTEPNGTWDNAAAMTSEGDNWYTCTIPVASCYVMFHTVRSTEQEPGQGESGYYASGEVWIKDKTVTFSSTVITSHIDIETGEKVAADVVDNQPKTTSNETYTTSALSADNVVVPGNSEGNYSAGITNVVYLYNGNVEKPTSSQPTSSEPESSENTTAPVPTEPVTIEVLMGDVDENEIVNIDDVTTIQLYLVSLKDLTDVQMFVADVDANGLVDITDATYIQCYLASLENTSYTGEYRKYVVESEEPDTSTAPAETTEETEPTTLPETEPTTEPTTEPSTAPITEPTTEPTDPTTEPITNPSADTYTVTFSNSLYWEGTISCYYWSEEDTTFTTWPGVEMTFLEVNDFGQSLYTCDIPIQADHIIFTNGTLQTVDIVFDGENTRFYALQTTTLMGSYEYATW